MVICTPCSTIVNAINELGDSQMSIVYMGEYIQIYARSWQANLLDRFSNASRPLTPPEFQDMPAPGDDAFEVKRPKHFKQCHAKTHLHPF